MDPETQDFLDEDIIPDQRHAYFLFSYVLTGNPECPAMFKMRGVKASLPECEKLAKRLGEKDKYFNIFTCETGKWGGLLSEELLRKELDDENSEFTQVYREKLMNDLMKTHKDKQDEARQFDAKRKTLMESTLTEKEKELESVRAEIETSLKQVQSKKDKLKELLKQPESTTRNVGEKQLLEDISNLEVDLSRKNKIVEDLVEKINVQKLL